MNRIEQIYPGDRVTLREVGLRDGLQLVKSCPSTEAKTDWIKREYSAGVRHFEVGSFLPVKTMPQFSDVRDLIRLVADLDGAFSSALALNERGATDALQAEVDEIVCVVSATEEHSRANMRCSREEAVALLGKVAEASKVSPTRPVVVAGISMAFGCSIAGEVSQSDVVRLVAQCLEAGADVIGLADTVGFVGPNQVGSLCRAVVDASEGAPVSAHLHDTRGMGIANASAALDVGIRILDGSLGGLGGCPFAPGASGNVVFEDLVYLCETKGYPTGIDLEALTEIRAIPEAEMPEEQFFGALAKAGPPQLIDWRAQKQFTQ